MYTKTFFEVLGFIVAFVIFIEGVIYSGVWVWEHLVVLVAVPILAVVLYYGFAFFGITTNTTGIYYPKLEDYVKHGPWKKYAMIRLRGVIEGFSRNELVHEIELAVEKRIILTIDTLRMMFIRLEHISASSQDFEKDVLDLLRKARGEERALVVEYLQPYMEARIMNAETPEVLNDMKARGLIPRALEEALKEKRFELYRKRIASASTPAELNAVLGEDGMIDPALEEELRAKRNELYDRDGRMVPRRVGGNVSVA